MCVGKIIKIFTLFVSSDTILACLYSFRKMLFFQTLLIIGYLYRIDEVCRLLVFRIIEYTICEFIMQFTQSSSSPLLLNNDEFTYSPDMFECIQGIVPLFFILDFISNKLNDYIYRDTLSITQLELEDKIMSRLGCDQDYCRSNSWTSMSILYSWLFLFHNDNV